MIYVCDEETGEISRIPFKEDWQCVASQFCIVKKYENIFNMDFRISPYSLFSSKKYKGLDRDPLEFTPDDFESFTENEAYEYFNLIDEKDDYDLIYIRHCGGKEKIPEGLIFLGYDCAYIFGHGYCDGFSAICDCLFICRWHGCDYKATEFSDDYKLLNQNGLFERIDDAYAYLEHYLKQEWSERGEFCVYEIYQKQF